MNCKKCGNALSETDKYCKVCGEMVVLNQKNTNEAPDLMAIPSESKIINNEKINYNNSTITDNSQNNISPDLLKTQNNLNQEKQNNKNTKTKISLIIGAISIVLSIFLSIFSVPLAVIGLIIGLISKEKGKNKIIAICLNLLSIAIYIFLFIIIISQKEIYYGDGYNLTYNYMWKPTTLKSGEKSLKYYDESIFSPVGTSDISSYVSCDIDLESCKKDLYDSFYDFLISDFSASSMKVISNKSFKLLKDDIYYATYNYGKSYDKFDGKYYLIISKEKDVIFSFITTTDNNSDLVEVDNSVIDLLKTINITYDSNNENNTNSNVIYDDEMADILDNLTSWNSFSSLREGNISKKNSITGGWRVLDESEQYWEFKDGQFWWYKSVNDLNDNYWHGTVKIDRGKEGLKNIGIDESKANEVISMSKGKVSENDIYSMILTPTKIISGGIDKSSTNIPENMTWKYVWVLVDHGDEGIEGQVVNITSGENLSFIKIND